LKFKRSFEAKIWRCGDVLFLTIWASATCVILALQETETQAREALPGPPTAPTTKLG
jgi:hypothetical protein